ncbi:MAG TPA: LamG-like jellyroll fold domain-containing protein, partial [Sedimentisphaerales bacterium]|nr:LamG-like jellyroll fold domain-containing protein [Sedimentisphaerales bacterium]
TTNAVGTVDAIASLVATSMPNVATGPSRIVAGTNSYGRVEYAYEFDGADDWFEFDYSADYDPGTNNWAFSIWMHNTNELGHNVKRGLFNMHGLTNDYSEIDMYVNGDGADDDDFWCLVYDTDQQAYGLNSLSDPRTSSGVWQNMAVVRDGSLATFYLDGEILKAVDNGAFGAIDLAGGVRYIGFMVGKNAWWGKLDDFRGYTNALSQAAVSNIVLNTNPTNNLEIR